MHTASNEWNDKQETKVITGYNTGTEKSVCVGVELMPYYSRSYTFTRYYIINAYVLLVDDRTPRFLD